jgi:hypothetical protein
MSVFSSVSSALGTKQDNRVSAVSLLEIAADGSLDTDSMQSFQYFPETITDSRSVNWIEKNVVGGSHPIYQWTYGSARTIGFEAVFTNEIAPTPFNLPPNSSVASSIESLGTVAGSVAKNPLGTTLALAKGSNPSYYSVNIPAAIAWLRALTYPLYGPPQSVSTANKRSAPRGQGTTASVTGLSGSRPSGGPTVGNSSKNAGNIIANAPPKLLLVMPNSGIASLAYGNLVDSIPCIMTSCNVTYESFFRTGAPRIVTVSLEFAEIVQIGQKNWGFISRERIDSLSDNYTYVNTNFENQQVAVATNTGSGVNTAPNYGINTQPSDVITW